MIITTAMLMDKLSNYANPANKIRRMADRGEIIPITKGLYETSASVPGYCIAPVVYAPSYLSFEYALSWHGLIPEAVRVYTSATCAKKKTKLYSCHFGIFSYRDIPAKAFPFGIKAIEEKGYFFRLASPEKALCDKLYSISPVGSIKALKVLLFEDLRIDEEKFAGLNKDDIQFLSGLYGSTNVRLLAKYSKK